MMDVVGDNRMLMLLGEVENLKAKLEEETNKHNQHSEELQVQMFFLQLHTKKLNYCLILFTPNKETHLKVKYSLPCENSDVKIFAVVFGELKINLNPIRKTKNVP